MKKTFLCFFVVISCLSLFATDVSGNQSGTWNLAGSPYNIVGEITVPAGETLTIEAGVEVVAMGNYKLTAEGNLMAQGTVNDSIRFYGNGGLDWGGIRLEDEVNSSTISYCRISNTNDTNDYGIHSVNSPVYVSYCVIDDHQKGVQFSALSSNNPSYMEITHSKVTNIQKSGITIVDNSNVLIDNCEVSYCALGGSPYGAVQLSLQSNSHSCSPTITNNYIHHNSMQGITLANLFGYANMEPYVAYNNVCYNYTGIYLYAAKGTYTWNHIHHNFVPNNADSGAGVMLYGSSANAVFTYNMIDHNYTGFYLTNGATANLGDLNNTDPNDDGYNCIYDNLFFTGEEFTVYNASSADVTAENTVWDDDPPIDVTIIDGNDNPSYGIVDYEPILSPFAPPDSIHYTLEDNLLETCFPGQLSYPTYLDFIGWNVYVNGSLIVAITTNPFVNIVLNPGDNIIGISYVYNDGESTITDTTVFIPHILNPPQNLEVVINSPYAYFYWDDPEPGSTSPPALTHFNVFIDGTLVGITNDNLWQFTDLMIGQTYTAGVCANYEAGASEIVEIPFTYNPTLINNPPQNPVVSPLGLMTWESPEPGSTSQLLHYNVFLDGTLVGTPTAPPWQFTGLVPGQTYIAEVSAVYEDGESDLVEATWEQIDHDPPVNAGYEVFSDHIHLYWEEPNQYVEEYHIYVDGVLHTTTELYFDIYDLIPGLVYEIALTALYIDQIESDPIVFNIAFVEGDDILNAETQLLGNYPNPFNPSTTISFSVTQSSDFATIEIYNLKGQKIKTFTFPNGSLGTSSSGSHAACQADLSCRSKTKAEAERRLELVEVCGRSNTYSVVWNGTDDLGKPVSSGVYFYQLRTGDKIFTKKMLMLK